MKYISKTKRMRAVLWLIVALTTGLFVFGPSNAQNAEGFTSHKGRFWKDKPVSCGDEIITYTSLTTDLDCSGHSGSAALTLQEGAKLNLNGKKIIGNFGINCIDVRGDDAKIWRGAVMQCDYGIRVRSDRNEIIAIKVSDSNNRGIRIDGNENLLLWCRVSHSRRQGIKIDGGNGNKIFSSAVYDSCRDGIEIEGGDDNMLFYNHVEDNGNPGTCADFEEDYSPWFYAGIDVLSGAENNKIKHNRAGCNLGCVGSDDFPCTPRERDFWDENVDTNGNGDAINEWKNNSIMCNNAVPEYGPNPSD
jgi:hypothetical protein